MSNTAIIAQRCQHLLASWERDPNIITMMSKGARIATIKALADANFPWEQADDPIRLGRRRTDNVFINDHDPHAHRNTSLWVREGYSGYRGAYIAFIKQVYDITLTPQELTPYNVDHTLNRARAPLGRFVRVEAIPAGINQAWGRHFEAAASHERFERNQTAETRSMSWMIAAKLDGQWPPHGPADIGGINRIARAFGHRGQLGLTPQEIAEGLRNMLSHAYRR